MRAGVPRRQRRLLTGTLRGPLKRVHSSPTKPRAQRAPRHAVERIPTVNYSGKAVFEWMRSGDLTAGVRTVWQAAIVDGDRRSDPPARRRAGLVDRKSTRLNSSHSQISYAVFCLKKKRKRQN